MASRMFQATPENAFQKLVKIEKTLQVMYTCLIIEILMLLSAVKNQASTEDGKEIWRVHCKTQLLHQRVDSHQEIHLLSLKCQFILKTR